MGEVNLGTKVSLTKNPKVSVLRSHEMVEVINLARIPMNNHVSN